MGLLDELFAGGQRQKEYSDFVDRYEQGKVTELSPACLAALKSTE